MGKIFRRCKRAGGVGGTEGVLGSDDEKQDAVMDRREKIERVGKDLREGMVEYGV